jgi:uncharacterized membrane protein
MPDTAATFEFLLRWFHFLAGITWIGLLYFFNLVNVPLMKALDGPTKGKVIPQLMPRTLWWFRHAAWVTVLMGFIYYVTIVAPEEGHHTVLAIWLVTTIAAWLVMWAIIKNGAWPVGQGKILAVVLGAVIVAHAIVILKLCGGPGHTSRALSIGIGGGMGTMMMLNVWMLIWPGQRRIIDWTRENAEKGTPIPPESAVWARMAFLASRANFWMSIPMLFFMAAASHYQILSKVTE